MRCAKDSEEDSSTEPRDFFFFVLKLVNEEKMKGAAGLTPQALPLTKQGILKTLFSLYFYEMSVMLLFLTHSCFVRGNLMVDFSFSGHTNLLSSSVLGQWEEKYAS